MSELPIRAGKASIADLRCDRMKKKKTGSKRSTKMVSPPVGIRPAAQADLTAINQIYNYFVTRSTCTYQEKSEPMTGRQQWFAHHGHQHPVVVAECNGKVVGWGSLSAYHPRAAYRRTVENSIYVHHNHHHRGIGTALMKDLIARARAIGHHAIIAVIDSEQEPSVALHDRFRFRKVGHFRQIGFKFGRWLDVIYMELLL
jgi:L-amino acid N-acyltransferase YncA